MPDFALEDAASGVVAGVDEVGRGPWAGPVVACAVVVDRTRFSDSLAARLDDSKKLTARLREDLFGPLQACCTHSLGEASVEEIDRLNILQAALLAMRRAVQALPVAPDLALVDGNRSPDLSCRVQTVVKGDGCSLSIAAASVIAKVLRDRHMATLAARHPGYGWERNAGYGTAEHRQGLERFGVTEHHRHSFAPISRYSK